MSSGILAIYDSDINYLHHLSEYLRSRDDFPYDIIVFSDLDRLNEYTLHSIDILVTSFIPEFIKDKDIGDIFYLSDNDVSSYEGYTCLYKFQSADNILRAIMENAKASYGSMAFSSNNCKVIGVYSPINRCGKTSLSLSLGVTLAKKAPTLLVSFDCFSFLSELTEKSSYRDISDLLFYFKEETSSINNKLLSLSYRFDQLNFICPPAIPSRLLSMDTILWCQLIESISKTGLYEYIVFDISNTFMDLCNFFNLCNIIYMPQIEDYTSERKIQAFFEFISNTTNLDIRCFHAVYLPLADDLSTKESVTSWVTHGKLGVFAKELLEVNHDNTFS